MTIRQSWYREKPKNKMQTCILHFCLSTRRLALIRSIRVWTYFQGRIGTIPLPDCLQAAAASGKRKGLATSVDTAVRVLTPSTRFLAAHGDGRTPRRPLHEAPHFPREALLDELLANQVAPELTTPPSPRALLAPSFQLAQAFGQFPMSSTLSFPTPLAVALTRA